MSTNPLPARSALDILQSLPRPPPPPGAESSSSSHRDDDSIRDRDRDWDKDCDHDRDRDRDSDREKDRLEKMAEMEREKELEAIKEQSVVSKKPRKRVIKPSEKFRVSFDWEDTSRDMSAFYQSPHEALLLYGHGFPFLAGSRPSPTML